MYTGAMDKHEAALVAEAKLDELRRRSYDALVSDYLGRPENQELIAGSGAEYQLEVEGFWDDRRKQHLRVVVAVDDGGWRAFVPLTRSFIIAPDGVFVGEQRCRFEARAPQRQPARSMSGRPIARVFSTTGPRARRQPPCPPPRSHYQSAFTRLDRRRDHRSSCRNGGSCWPASMSATSIGVRRIGAISRCILASATPSVATRQTQQRPVPSASCSSSREATLRQVMSRASLASGCRTRRARAVGRGRGRLERMLRSAEPTPPYRRSAGSNGPPGRRPWDL